MDVMQGYMDKLHYVLFLTYLIVYFPVTTANASSNSSVNGKTNNWTQLLWHIEQVIESRKWLIRYKTT